MLLLTAIERYTSLQYHLGKKVMAKINRMALATGFPGSASRHIERRADRVLDQRQELRKARSEQPRKKPEVLLSSAQQYNAPWKGARERH